MARQINADGLKLIKQWEGCVLFAYDDFDPPSSRRRIQPGDVVHGTLTIGYGHTGPDVKPGMTITEAQATALLRKDLAVFEKVVADAIHVTLEDNQFAALVAFAFNIGAGAFRGSSLVRKLNTGDYKAVPNELMKWTTSKGKPMAGLVNRRSAESGLWARGQFVASNTVPVEPKKAPGSTTQKAGAGTAIGGAATTAATQIAGFDMPVLKYIAAALVIVGLVAMVWGILHSDKEQAA